MKFHNFFLNESFPKYFGIFELKLFQIQVHKRWTIYNVHDERKSFSLWSFFCHAEKLSLNIKVFKYNKYSSISFYRFNEKIAQLKEFGLIGYWIEMEQDKVARLAKLGRIFIYILSKKIFH